jgi:hypothetical protein
MANEVEKFDPSQLMQGVKEIAETTPLAMLNFFRQIAFNATNQLRSDIQNHRV